MIEVKEGRYGKIHEASRRIKYNETMKIRVQEKADKKIAEYDAKSAELRKVLADLQAENN